MKQLFGRFVKYLGTAAVAYVAFALLVGNLGLENRVPNTLNLTGEFDRSLLRFREAETSEPVDVVFLGSSHTYRGFDPRIFKAEGMSAFNLGSSAQTPLNSYRVIKRYIETLQPKVLVFESYWGVFESPNGSEASINIACNAPASLDFLTMTLQSHDVRAVNSVLTNYGKRMLHPLTQAQQIDFGRDVYVQGGYSETSRPSTARAEVAKLKPYSSSIAQVQVDYLKEIVELCKANDCQVVLARTPVTKEYFENLENYEEVTEPIQAFAQRHELLFHDFNLDMQSGALQLDTEAHFYDKNHLNQAGVEVFNPFLIEWMAEKGLTPK